MRALSLPMTPSMVSPSARAAKVSAMRCLRIGSAIAMTSSIDGESRPSMRARARATSISAWLARGLGPQEISLPSSPVSGPGRAERTSLRIASTTDSPTGNRRTRRCAAEQLVGGHGRLRLALFRAGGVEHDFALGLVVGIVDVDLHQEAVELRFRKGIGALLLDRVLGGEHVEGARHVVTVAGDRDVVLLHRLQQRRLGARARAVDLVGHQQLPEDRARDEAEAALAAGALLQHFAAQDVGRHEVGGELDAAGVESEHDAHGLDQLGLGEAGKADQQRVPAAQHGDERLLDHRLLPEDHIADRGLGGGDLGAGRFRLAHDHVFELFQPIAGYGHDVNSLLSDPSSTLRPGLGWWFVISCQSPSDLTKKRATFGPRAHDNAEALSPESRTTA